MTLQCVQMIPIDTLVCFNVLFLLSQDLSMIGWLKNNQHLCFCMMAKLLHALSKWSSAKNHRAEEIPWWYWTCRINYSSFMPTKAKSVPYCASFIAWRKVSKAGWLKVAQTAQATPPCNTYQISLLFPWLFQHFQHFLRNFQTFAEMD